MSAAATTATSITADAATPSMTLKVTPDDARNVLQASEALKKCLQSLQQSNKQSSHESKDETTTAAATTTTTNEEEAPVPSRVVSTSDNESDPVVAAAVVAKPLHAQLLDAASACDDALIQEFCAELQELKYNTPEQQQACLLLFLDKNKETKTRDAFDILGKGELSCEQSATLFRCVLTSIRLCIQEKTTSSPNANENEEKPAKARKEDDQSSPSSASRKQQAATESLSSDESPPPPSISSKSPSFDNTMMEDEEDDSRKKKKKLSLATLQEIDEICNFASTHLTKYMTGATTVTFQKFEEWYKAEGATVVPWMELLDLNKWSDDGVSPERPSAVKAEEPVPKEPEKVEEEPTLPDVKMESEEKLAAVFEPPPVAAATASPAKKDPPKPVPNEAKSEAPNFFMMEDEEPPSRANGPPSKTLVSFDFTGSSSSNSGKAPFCIHITEDNLLTLRSLVQRTNLATRAPSELCKVLLNHSKKHPIEENTMNILLQSDFGQCIRDLVPHEAARTFSREEMENFSIYFTNFFACYENSHEGLGKDRINVTEFAIGFSLLCAGNKSSKLASGFELMDDRNMGFLTKAQLTDYLRSYLTMLVGISLLSKNPEKHESLSESRKKDMLDAVANGAKWTLGHYLKEHTPKDDDRYSFDSFARWYTEGGYNIAPWLELLDLKKLLSLLPEETPHMALSPKIVPSSAFRGGRHTSPRRRKTPGGYPQPSGNDILFTFPLAKNRSLVVLREDATYVRSVVEKLGLLSLTPDDIWGDLYDRIMASPPPPSQPWSRSRHRKTGTGKSMDVDQQTFVQCMDVLLQTKARGRKRTSHKAGPTETLQNFYQSFDLQQIDRVALNQLMGGLSLLCGGKKSTKLAFSFGLFDGRGENEGKSSKNPSLNVEDLFVFLRSFLIVMFSCCRQSLDLSADQVGRYIADTAHMVAEDVMRYQWHTRNKDRVDFDEFGEWYNEGGFETAPWLELLDLNKWVLVEDPAMVSHHRQQQQQQQQPNVALKPRGAPSGHYCPPPPPEDSVDPSFFGDDDAAILPMDSMDDMDLMLMQQPSHDKENDAIIDNNNKGVLVLPTTPSPKDPRGSASRPLKFHLVSHGQHGGYMVSVSQKRVRHLRHVLVESGLYKIEGEAASQKILNKALRTKSKGTIKYVLEKDDFDSAMRDIVSSVKGKGDMSVDTQRALSDLLAYIFSAFDRDKTGKVDATELACGFTVLCHGKKSDKLEYAFEVLDVNRNGKLSRGQVSNYLRSFLTVLLCVTTSSHLQADPAEDVIQYMNNGKPCDHPNVAARAADAGSAWAAGQAFKASAGESLNFDEFADWYTSKGYSSIPWLELLDLRKWVVME